MRNRYRRNKVLNMLITKEQVKRVPDYYFQSERENIVRRLSDDAKLELHNTIYERYDSAIDQTRKMADQMVLDDKQYLGLWQDNDADLTETPRVFLPKTREQVDSVYAYLMFLMSQLDPLVVMMPMVSNIDKPEDEFRNAKVMEALGNYYLKDVLHLRDDILPTWIKTFLKYSMAIWKVTYNESSEHSDIDLSVVDRALLTFDPHCHNLKDARWTYEEYFLPRTEVIDRVERGIWYWPKNQMEKLYTTGSVYSAETGQRDIDSILKRYFGDNYDHSQAIDEDDLIICGDYFQAAGNGLDDSYLAFVGGIEEGNIVWMGRNPLPYKGIPYRAKSFSPDEYEVDGRGMVELQKPFQEVINNFYNMRVTDVMKNIIRPVATPGNFINEQTMEDWRNGNKLIRLDEAIMEAAKDPSFDIRKYFAELPINVSTDGLLIQDLPFILSQMRESANVSELFQGNNPPRQMTLGQVNEQLYRNQAQYRPIYLQVMRGLTEVMEIMTSYFKSPDFFDTERIVQIIGENRYVDVIQNWHEVPGSGGNFHVRRIEPDEMHVKVSIDCVSGADAQAARSYMLQSIEIIFQSIGQIPELIEELKKKLDFSRIFELMLKNSGADLDSILLTDEQKRINQQEEQASLEQEVGMQQQMQQMQLQFNAQLEEIKSQFKQMEEQNRISLQMERDQRQWEYDEEQTRLEHRLDMEELVTRIAKETLAKIAEMETEYALEAKNARAENRLKIGDGNIN